MNQNYFICPRCRGTLDFDPGPWYGSKNLPSVPVCEAPVDATESLSDLKKKTSGWKKERDQLLDMTMMLDEHPEGYEGPCLCKLCQSYGD